MKKYKLASMVILTAGISTQLFANCSNNGNFTPFTTVEQEQACCPNIDPTSENALFFKANNPLPNSTGIITGQQNNLEFISVNINKTNIVPRPQTVNSNGTIANVNYGGHPGTSDYGYISGNQITCFYTYNQATTGGPFYLNIQNTNQQ